MNRNETAEILSFCKNVWPDYYKGKGKGEHETILTEWATFFRSVSKRHVLTSVYCLADRPVHPTKEEIEAKARELFPVSMKSEKPGYEYPEQKTKEAEKCISSH